MSSSNWQNELDAAIDRRFDRMVEIRRHMHAHPEVSGHERETSLYLYQLLGDEGLTVRMGPEGHGVVADLPIDEGEEAEAKIALRADIDALRIHDDKSVEYRSRNEGVMHACGHDAHSATVFGAITSLGELREANRLPWEVPLRGIFQPAEETTQGAKQMIEIGALDGVEAILALHVDPSRQAGGIGLRDGVMTANCDDMQVDIFGRGGHAARPHEANDPIAAAAQLINALYLFIPRVTDSQDAVVATIGQIDGGDNSNVIPEKVVLRGTLRTLDSKIRLETIDHIRRMAAGISQTSDTTMEVHFSGGAPSVFNDTRLNELLRRAGGEVLNADAVQEIPRPSMGSEDFSFYLDRVPGAMFRLGVASGGTSNSPLHSSTFDIDEEALRYGAKILARAAVGWFDPQRRTTRLTVKEGGQYG